MKDRLLRNWHGMRILRAVIAVIFVMAAVSRNEPIAWIAAAFFGMQAIVDLGCGGSTSCRPLRGHTSRMRPDGPVTFEEIR